MLSFHHAQRGCISKPNPLVILCIIVLVSVVSAVPAGITEETCVNPRKKAGTCIIITACPELQSILANRPVSGVNRLYLSESQCGQVGRHPKVCCANKANSANNKYNNNRPVVTPALKETREEEFDFSKMNKLIPDRRFCGDSFTEKTIGGNATDLDQYPWMALLGFQKKGDGGYDLDFRCGGSLVSNRYILTAAHCLTKLDSGLELKKIRLGEWDLEQKKDCVKGVCSEPPVDIDVENILVHERYEPNSQHQRNDIALIRMAEEVKTSPFIATICLPLIDERVSKRTHFGEDMIVSGWGETDDGLRAKVKQQVQLPMVEQDECRDFWKQTQFIVDSSQFCAGGREGKDTCKGDSGGPIFIKELDGNQENWFIRGIISSGAGKCGTEDAFSLYTDVTKFNNWIWKNIKP